MTKQIMKDLANNPLRKLLGPDYKCKVGEMMTKWRKGDEKAKKGLLKWFGMFRKAWIRGLVAAGADKAEAPIIHDEIVARCMERFKEGKTKCKDDRFNAYVVSALVNQCKGLRCWKLSVAQRPKLPKYGPKLRAAIDKGLKGSRHEVA